MSADDYRKLRAEDTLVADLRFPLDYLQGHLEGAMSLPGTRYHLRYQLAELGPDRPLVLIAQAPVDIDPLIKEAEAAGAQVTGVLTGAPRGWQARGLPVLAWSSMTVLELAEWQRTGTTLTVVDVSEAHEPAVSDFPDAERVPLSTWTRDTVERLQASPTLLLGAAARVRYAAVRLYEGGARDVYFGQTASPKTDPVPAH
jgi:rhodanese-related sulfurtransferase